MIIQIPTNCPCCDYTLELVNDQLFCRNTACGAQLNKKIEHFTKTLGIKGFGPKTVEKLGLSDLTEVFYLDRADAINSLGSEKTVDKLLEEIDRARGADLATVLASFSIPLIGETASGKLAAVVSNIDEITAEKCKEAGLGDKATANIMEWLTYEFKDLREFLPFSFKSENKLSVANGETICITGKLKSFKTKSAAYEALTAAGYKVVESVTKSLVYLVDEQGNGSSKRKTADEYGVTIINNLIDFLKKESS